MTEYLVSPSKVAAQEAHESEVSRSARARAKSIATAGGLAQALEKGLIEKTPALSLSEALLLGLLKQGVCKYLAIFGHGSTDLAEILRVYEEEGVTRTYNFRNEVAMAHAATQLRWQYGETVAVVTSIGPGGLQAMAGSLAASSNGVGVYHIYGDETTFGEGANMQQLPKDEQGLYGQITAAMGQSYVLHTPHALRDALRRGSICVNHPYRAGPFFLLLPINQQPAIAAFNLAAFPERVELAKQAPADNAAFAAAADLIERSQRVVIKAGGGTRGHDAAIRRLAEAAGAPVVLSPGSTGILPEDAILNMHVGGSKGSISGNFAMEHADLLIAIGSRAVCQADCSGIGYPAVQAVININGDLGHAMHYNKTTALLGDVGAVADRLASQLESRNLAVRTSSKDWIEKCAEQKRRWRSYRDARTNAAPLFDVVWGRSVLGQPAAIQVVCDFAKAIDAAKLFDAGDVQANGFQIVQDDRTGDTFTETGASYMGFASSALVATGIAEKPRYTIALSGDGSFFMNPQVLVDAVEHNVCGMLVIFDNRRMAAISSLQRAQYGRDFKTSDQVAVDYVKLASAVDGVLALHGGFTAASLWEALARAHAYPGFSVLHVPVYSGDDPLGGLGAWGSWNVGNWCADVQSRWLAQDL